MGVVELVIILVVIGLAVGPRRVMTIGEQVTGNFRRVQASVTGQPAPPRPAPAGQAASSGRSAAPASGNARPLLVRLWDLSNVIGFALVAAGLAIIVADLNWWHLGPPALALGVLLLAVGTFCLAW